VAGTRFEDRGLQNSSSGYTVGSRELRGYKKKSGRPRKNCRIGHHQTRSEGHGQLDTTWEEAEKLVTDRAELRQRQRVAQCMQLSDCGLD